MLCVSEVSPEDERADSPAESRGVKRKISLTRCDVCENEEAKYRCPNCLKFSCSLPCVKSHKLQSGCSGVRDKTVFVALSEFSEINLLNDYRYLEETARVADKPNRDTILHTHPHLSYSVKLLKKNATAAKVNLKILPRSFTRRKENTSIYIKVEKKLYWYLKLHFPQSSAEYTDRVPEDRVLEQILSNYIHPTESDPVKRQRLKLYVLTPSDQMCVFLKSEQRQPGSPKYQELNVKKTLRENLMYKTVVEYPELYVVLKEHRQEYLTKFPERRSAAQASSPKASSSAGEVSHPAPSSSRDDPETAECPKHVVKKRKSTADESEVEEGEIRSEEEEEEDDGGKDERPVCSADHAEDQHSMDTDRCLPHNDDDDDDGGGDQGGTAMETDDPSSHGHVEEDDGQVDDAVAAAVNSQNVTMETDHRLPHSEKEEDNGDDGDGQQGGPAQHQNVTMRASDPPSSHDQVEENDDDDGPIDGVSYRPDAVNDQKVTMETPEPSPHGRCGENEEHQVDQKVTMETPDPLPHGHSEQGGDEGQVHGDGGVDSAVAVNDQTMSVATADPSPHDHGEVDDQGQVDEGSDGAAAVSEDNVTVERDHSLHLDEGQVDGVDRAAAAAAAAAAVNDQNINDDCKSDIEAGCRPPPSQNGQNS